MNTESQSVVNFATVTITGHTPTSAIPLYCRVITQEQRVLIERILNGEIEILLEEAPE